MRLAGGVSKGARKKRPDKRYGGESPSDKGDEGASSPEKGDLEGAIARRRGLCLKKAV